MTVNDRVCLNSNIGTIKYEGSISKKAGTWYGIEWDDPMRGKGDGSVDGIRYFTSKSPTGASFMKATAPSLVRGRTFLEALREKYIESASGEGFESIVLGSSDGAIEVEAVNMNKVRGKFALLDTLKEVGLENYMISSAGGAGDIATTCPDIRRLDLSRNLFSSWEEVISIARQLHRLESLTLHENILRPLTIPLVDDCKSVTELRLNRTGTTWDQSLLIAPAFPSLKSLELGYNQLASLETTQEVAPGRLFPHLLSMNFDSNTFRDWRQLLGTLQSISGLQALYISENQINHIDMPSKQDSPLLSVSTLVLDGNSLTQWSSIDAVAAWLPNVSNLHVVDTPLMTDPETSKYSRQILIGRVATLQRLNSSEVSEQERKDSEIFYLNWIVRNTTPKDRQALHPRWQKLVELYGLPDEEKPTADQTRLQNRLMSVNIYRLLSNPSKRPLPPSEATFAERLQVLPTMPFKALRLKLLKTLKAKPSTHIRVFTKLKTDESGAGVWGEIELDSSRQSDLLWWGVEDGGDLGVYI